MSNFFSFFLWHLHATAEKPPPADDWQPSTYRPRRVRQPNRPPAPTEPALAGPRPAPAPVRYGDPPAKALRAA